MNLFHIRLTNGNEIITQMESDENPSKYYLINPLAIIDVMDKESGVTTVFLQDYVPYNTTKIDVELNKDQVVSLSKVDGSMVDFYKTSLEFCILFSSKEASEKIKHTTKHLNAYIKSQVSNAFSIPLDSTEELLLEEDELDEETLDSMTSSNTTYH